MAAQITELTFLKYLAPRFSIPVPEHLNDEASGAEMRNAIIRWGGKALVKPDIMTGRRGKAGMIRTVTDYAEAQRKMKQVQGLEINGCLPRTAYLVQYIHSDTEIYTAITYDSRYLGPALTISLSGGTNVEDIEDSEKITFQVDVYTGLGAYQASKMLEKLNCHQKIVNQLSRHLVDFWDMFISTGMRMCEINPWRIGADSRPFACDFKAIFDEANFKFKNIGFKLPEYPANVTPFEEEMAAWDASSYRGQAHVADLGGKYILPILFGGGASTIIVETLIQNSVKPLFLSDFGGNPPYERMFGTARICFEHNLEKTKLILLLGGKANNTLIDVTFKAIADALQDYVDRHGAIKTPVIIGRGGPQLVKGLLTMKDTLESLGLPYVIFGPDTPLTQVAEYAAKFTLAYIEKERINEGKNT